MAKKMEQNRSLARKYLRGLEKLLWNDMSRILLRGNFPRFKQYFNQLERIAKLFKDAFDVGYGDSAGRGKYCLYVDKEKVDRALKRLEKLRRDSN